ncbi:MAG TPA: GNAT family N-acetyltransferase, partial [Hyphomicrobiaceae bacterium]|nr:GNAT family N-acetyltransferase [Hyphomicrobiaceae bacterium]
MPEVKVIERIEEVPAADWNRLAVPDGAPANPFVMHEFLAALERSGSVGPRTGWAPRHLVLRETGALQGAMPLYLKTHSQGEYVFDHGWAEAFQRAGGQYYPKLQAAVPFTPVPGPRLLVGAGEGAAERERLLAKAAIEVGRRMGVSSLHVTFLDEAQAERIAGEGYLLRTGRQFHWQNRDYRSFDDFLASLASRKRKAVRKERAEAIAGGISIEHLADGDITEAHWDAFFDFYMDTGGRKWGRPYLNRRFFSELGASMADRCLLVMAKRDGRYIAGALNLVGGDCLYGRYWGAIEHHPCLHFEVCYYQAIEWAIGRRLPRVEAGAQGD